MGKVNGKRHKRKIVHGEKFRQKNSRYRTWYLLLEIVKEPVSAAAQLGSPCRRARSPERAFGSCRAATEGIKRRKSSPYVCFCNPSGPSGHLPLHRGGTGLLLDVSFFDTLKQQIPDMVSAVFQLLLCGAISFQRVKPRISKPPAACHIVMLSPRTVTEITTATRGSM